MRDEFDRKWIVMKAFAAQMGRKTSDICQCVDLYAEQLHVCSIRCPEFEWYACKSKKAGRIWSGQESIDKGCFDLIEVRLRRLRVCCRIELMWRLPLSR